ncbi:MAG: MW1434 family type I TA system toxin [Methanobacterium sp.]
MDFSKALEAIKAGKKIKRSYMQPNQYIIYDEIFKDKFALVTLSDKYLFAPVPYRFTTDDILADDWKLIEDS